MTQKANVPSHKAEYSPITSLNYKNSNSSIYWKLICLLIVILALICVAVFIVVPITFMLSEDFQTSMVLPRWSFASGNFTDQARYGLNGVRNFYVKLKNNVTLGVWHIVPESLSNLTDLSLNYENLLYNSTFPVLLFFHGNGRDRTGSIDLYKIQRRYFHIIAFDYRGYGDSSYSKMTEDGIVYDTVLLYKWLQNSTNADIYVWGHSLGTGVSTIALAKLNTEGIQPKGLILETPFTCSRDVIRNSHFGPIFSWLPWFEVTILDPVDNNNLGFNLTKYITSVECPIMILHAQDDKVIPYKLGKKLYEVVRDNRNNSDSIKFYTFEKHLKYGHTWICRDPRLPTFIKNFLDYCQRQVQFRRN